MKRKRNWSCNVIILYIVKINLITKRRELLIYTNSIESAKIAFLGYFLIVANCRRAFLTIYPQHWHRPAQTRTGTYQHRPAPNLL